MKKFLFCIILYLLLLPDISYSQIESDDVKLIYVSNPISLNVGDFASSIVRIRNPSDERVNVILDLSTNDEQFKNWIWFDGHKYDEGRRNLELILEPKEQTGVGIILFGGKQGIYNMFVVADFSNNPQLLKSENLGINVIYDPKEFLASAPGLNSYSFILVIMLSSLFMWRRL